MNNKHCFSCDILHKTDEAQDKTFCATLTEQEYSSIIDSSDWVVPARIRALYDEEATDEFIRDLTSYEVDEKLYILL